MARFTQFGDAHVRDLETYNFLPINQCSVQQVSVTRGIYVARLDHEADVLFRIDTVWTSQLYNGGYARSRGIVIDYEGDTCPVPDDLKETHLSVKTLTPHVVAIQMGFDPVFYADGLPLFP